MKAVKDFEAVVKLCPKDDDAKEKLKKAKSLAMQQAIHKDGGDSEIVSLNPDDQAVEESQDGPVLEQQVDFEFINKLKTQMKDQKKLHTKYLIILLNKAINFFKTKRSTVQDVTVQTNEKLTVCGDVHGQQ